MDAAELRAYLLGVIGGAPPRGSDPAIGAALARPSIVRTAEAWLRYAQAESAAAREREAPPQRHKLPWHLLAPMP